MKSTLRWLLTVLSKALTVVLIIVLLPAVRNVFQPMLKDLSGKIIAQSHVIERNLASSKRLEFTTVDEEGVLDAKTNVILLGTVGSTVIHYRYTASVGIDLSRVIMVTDSERIIFMLPEAEILNDGIEALQIDRHNLFSKAIEESVESLLQRQRLRCREEYLADHQFSEEYWQDLVSAFRETICQWLSNDGRDPVEFEFIRLDG